MNCVYCKNEISEPKYNKIPVCHDCMKKNLYNIVDSILRNHTIYRIDENGFAYATLIERCDCCNDIYLDGDLCDVDNYNVCPTCKDSEFLECDNCGDYFYRKDMLEFEPYNDDKIYSFCKECNEEKLSEIEDVYYCENGEHYHAFYLEDNPIDFSVCCECNKNIVEENLEELRYGKFVCDICKEKEYSHCKFCDSMVKNIETIVINDEEFDICSDCKKEYTHLCNNCKKPVFEQDVLCADCFYNVLIQEEFNKTLPKYINDNVFYQLSNFDIFRLSCYLLLKSLKERKYIYSISIRFAASLMRNKQEVFQMKNCWLWFSKYKFHDLHNSPEIEKIVMDIVKGDAN